MSYSYVGAIAEAIRTFDFGNYGLDVVDEVKDEDWVNDLAQHIRDAFI